MSRRWSKDHTYCIGSDAANFCNLQEVHVLDRLTFKSVEEAVTALNSGAINCPEYCVVYSMRRQAYYLLWANEKSEAEANHFAAMVKQRSTGAPLPNKTSQQASSVKRSTPQAPLSQVYQPNGIRESRWPSDPGSHNIPTSIQQGKSKDVFRLDKFYYQSGVGQNSNANSETSTTDTTPVGTTPNTERDMTPMRAKLMAAQSGATSNLAHDPNLPFGTAPPTIPRNPSQSRLLGFRQASGNQGGPPSGYPPGVVRALTPTRVGVQRRSISPTTRPGPPTTLSPRRYLPTKVGGTGGEDLALDKPIMQESINGRGEATPNVPQMPPVKVQDIPDMNMVIDLEMAPTAPLSERKEIRAGVPNLGAPTTSSYQPPTSAAADQELHVDTEVFDPQRAQRDPSQRAVSQGRTTCDIESGPSPTKEERVVEGSLSPPKKVGAGNRTLSAPRKAMVVAASAPSQSTPLPPVPPATQLPPPVEVPHEQRYEVTTLQKSVALADVTTMTVEELQMDTDYFDPLRPPMRSLLLDRLGLPQTMTIESLQDNPGSFNDGVWMVFDGHTSGLVLKLVPHARSHPVRATDAEKFINLQRRCPKLVTEFSLAFPLRIFQLKNPRGARSKDLIVMRRASGLQLTQHLYHKFHHGLHPQLIEMFRELGTFLGVLHRVYKGMQHGDCQPSNVFYDELSGVFTLIDVADFGYGPFVAEGGENDVEHFVDGLKTLTQWYGDNFIADLSKQFKSAYFEESGRRR